MSTISMQFSACRESSSSGTIRTALKAFWLHWQNRRAMRALARLDDYMLKDMGISRSEICSRVYRISPGRACGGCEE